MAFNKNSGQERFSDSSKKFGSDAASTPGVSAGKGAPGYGKQNNISISEYSAAVAATIQKKKVYEAPAANDSAETVQERNTEEEQQFPLYESGERNIFYNGRKNRKKIARTSMSKSDFRDEKLPFCEQCAHYDFKDKEGLAGISACGGAVGQERLKKLNTSLSYLESAISRTMRIKDLYSHKFIECLDAGEKFLAMFEIENILLYLYIKQYYGEAQDQRELLFALYRYLERNMQDAVLRAQYLAKTGILLGCILLAGGDCAACVKMHEKIIGLNRECGMLVCVMPLLEQIIAACERLGDTGKAEWYKKQKENFLNIFQDSNLSIQCLNKLYYTCRMRQYFVEGRLIAAERKWKKMTQQELAEGIYQYCASISRIETGKENSGRKKFYRIMEKLGIDCTRYNGNLLTDEFCVLELDRDIERHLARGQYEEAGHELYLLERSVDMNEKCNQQLVLGLKNMEALRAGKIGTEEALENARELLEMTYHLENVEEGGERYRRVPFRNEMYLFNQICIILRKDGRIMEAVELMERMMRTYDATVEARNFHNKNIYLCAINLCQYLERVDRLEEAERYANGLIREKLIYGKILGLHRLYSTKFDVAEKLGSDIENRKKLLYQAYFLSDWCNVDKDSRILEKALKERFGN